MKRDPDFNGIAANGLAFWGDLKPFFLDVVFLLNQFL
jgi:hypothetical protein